MGKSFKKTPVLKENGASKKKLKNHANKVVRSKLKDHDFSIANGSAYKKEYESYDIADYVCYQSKEDAILAYKSNSYLREQFTLEEWLIEWKKKMIRK